MQLFLIYIYAKLNMVKYLFKLLASVVLVVKLVQSMKSE